MCACVGRSPLYPSHNSCSPGQLASRQHAAPPHRRAGPGEERGADPRQAAARLQGQHPAQGEFQEVAGIRAVLKGCGTIKCLDCWDATERADAHQFNLTHT